MAADVAAAAGGGGVAGVVSGISEEGVMIELLTGAVDLSEQPIAEAIPPSDNILTNLRRVNIAAFNG